MEPQPATQLTLAASVPQIPGWALSRRRDFPEMDAAFAAGIALSDGSRDAMTSYVELHLAGQLPHSMLLTHSRLHPWGRHEGRIRRSSNGSLAFALMAPRLKSAKPVF